MTAGYVFGPRPGYDPREPGPGYHRETGHRYLPHHPTTKENPTMTSTSTYPATMPAPDPRPALAALANLAEIGGPVDYVVQESEYIVVTFADGWRMSYDTEAGPDGAAYAVERDTGAGPDLIGYDLDPWVAAHAGPGMPEHIEDRARDALAAIAGYAWGACLIAVERLAFLHSAPDAPAPAPTADEVLDALAAWLADTDDEGQWRSACDFIEFAAFLIGQTGRPTG